MHTNAESFNYHFSKVDENIYTVHTKQAVYFYISIDAKFKLILCCVNGFFDKFDSKEE